MGPALINYLETTCDALNELGFATDISEVYFCTRLALLRFESRDYPRTMMSIQIYSDLVERSGKYRNLLKKMLLRDKGEFVHSAKSLLAKKQIQDWILKMEKKNEA